MSKDENILDVPIRLAYLWTCESCKNTFSIPEEELLIQSGDCPVCGQLVRFVGFRQKIRIFSRAEPGGLSDSRRS